MPTAAEQTTSLGRLWRQIQGAVFSGLDSADKLFLTLLTIIFLVAYNYIYDPKLDLNGDNVNYYLLGRSIAHGKGYTQLARADEPPAHHFPPGYPALIAVVFTLVSENVAAVKLFNGLLLIFAAWLLYILVRRITADQQVAFAVALMVLLNTHFLRSATIMMSEVPFFFFSLLTFYLFLRLNLEQNQLRRPGFYLFLACLSLTYYIRTLGITLFGGIMLYLLIQRRWKYLAILPVSYIALALPWVIRGQQQGGSSYIGQLLAVNPYRPELGRAGLGDIITRLGNNITRYVTTEIPNGLLPFIPADYQSTTGVQWVLGLALCALVGYGIYRLEPRYRLLISGYLAGTGVILLLWPDVWFGTRFLLPVIPFLLVGLLTALSDLLRRLLIRYKLPGKRASLILALIPLGWLPLIGGLHDRAQGNYPRNWQNYFKAAIWVGENSPVDAVVACRKPGMFYYFSGRHTVYYRNTLDDLEMLAQFDEQGVDYVIFDRLGYSSTQRYLLPTLTKHREKFPVAWQLKNPDTYVLAYQP